jgi:hypothetical protein
MYLPSLCLCSSYYFNYILLHCWERNKRIIIIMMQKCGHWLVGLKYCIRWGGGGGLVGWGDGVRLGRMVEDQERWWQVGLLW